MKRSLVFTSVVLLSVAFVPSVNAQSPGPFIGLWEGIDPVDGGESRHSITCSGSGSEATCEVTVTFSKLPQCNLFPAHGVGQDGLLEADALRFVFLDTLCSNGNFVDLEIHYEHDLSNDTLVAEIIVNGGERRSAASTSTK
jgi:hypothetical protein